MIDENKLEEMFVAAFGAKPSLCAYSQYGNEVDIEGHVNETMVQVYKDDHEYTCLLCVGNTETHVRSMRDVDSFLRNLIIEIVKYGGYRDVITAVESINPKAILELANYINDELA